ncbi:MAG: flagellar hook-basal body protein [Caldimicrobium sp.]
MAGIRINPQLGLLEALEGAQLLERKFFTVTNNLANVDTPGFKAKGLSFKEVLMKKIGPNYKRAFKESHNYIDPQQGYLEPTQNPLNFSIVGEGFFKVQTPEGVAYTRAGNFTIDAERRLVTPQGYPVLANGAAVVLDPGMAAEGLVTMDNLKLRVSPDGLLSIDGTEIARLDVVTFDDLSKLKARGENLYISEGAQEMMATNYEIKQGYVEKSNVNVIKEMVLLIEIHRAFESLQRSIRANDEATEKLLETARR